MRKHGSDVAAHWKTHKGLKLEATLKAMMGMMRRSALERIETIIL